MLTAYLLGFTLPCSHTVDGAPATLPLHLLHTLSYFSPESLCLCCSPLSGLISHFPPHTTRNTLLLVIPQSSPPQRGHLLILPGRIRSSSGRRDHPQQGTHSHSLRKLSTAFSPKTKDCHVTFLC